MLSSARVRSSQRLWVPMTIEASTAVIEEGGSQLALAKPLSGEAA
jgi:hypothetical protein